jgi:hypothetical protein
MVHRWWIVSSSGEVIEERRVGRIDPGFFSTPLSVEKFSSLSDLLVTPSFRGPVVYPVSPLVGGTASVTLSDVKSSSALQSDQFLVRREQNTITPVLVDVDPAVDFTSVSGFSTSPASFSYSCTGGSGACPNTGAAVER